jgi:hypothetical protein
MKTKQRKSTGGTGLRNGPKISYYDDKQKMRVELYGHCCRNTKEAEDYVAMLFPESSFKVDYDDEKA